MQIVAVSTSTQVRVHGMRGAERVARCAMARAPLGVSVRLFDRSEDDMSLILDPDHLAALVHGLNPAGQSANLGRRLRAGFPGAADASA